MRRMAALCVAFCVAFAAAGASAQALLDFSSAERAAIASHGPWPQVRRLDTSNRVDGKAADVFEDWSGHVSVGAIDPVQTRSE